MQRATKNDKELVKDILCSAFQDNKSVNYIVPQDKKKHQRIRALMDYSFEVCTLYGQVYLSDDRKACALVYLSDQKKTNLKSVLLDIKLILECTGLRNILKVLRRENAIKRCYPGLPLYYLWFIGVAPQFQNQGTGRKLLDEILEDAQRLKRPVYLETSSEKNVSWYSDAGFEMYQKLDTGYDLFMFRNQLK